VHEDLGPLRERGTVLLDHAESLVNVFLDVRVWITRSDDTLRSSRQRVRPLPEPCCGNLPYLGHAQHPDERIPTGNDYKSCPVVKPVRWGLQKKKRWNQL